MPADVADGSLVKVAAELQTRRELDAREPKIRRKVVPLPACEDQQADQGLIPGWGDAPPDPVFAVLFLPQFKQNNEAWRNVRLQRAKRQETNVEVLGKICRRPHARSEQRVGAQQLTNRCRL